MIEAQKIVKDKLKITQNDIFRGFQWSKGIMIYVVRLYNLDKKPPTGIL